MPRTFVNLVQIIDVGLLVNVEGIECDVVHKYVYFNIKFLLPCILNKFIPLMFIGYFRFVCDCASHGEISQTVKAYQVLKLDAHMNRHTFIHMNTNIHILIYVHIYHAIHTYVHTCFEYLALSINLSQEEIEKLGDSGRYNTTDDFTVVVQPFMIGMHIPLLVSEQDPKQSSILINTL